MSRPQESLGQRPPAEFYEPSPRPYPTKLPEPQYPGHYEVRIVRSRGDIKFRGRKYYVTQALHAEPLGLVETDDRRWSVRFMSLELGQLDERKQKFYPIRGAKARRRRSV